MIQHTPVDIPGSSLRPHPAHSPAALPRRAPPLSPAVDEDTPSRSSTPAPHIHTESPPLPPSLIPFFLDTPHPLPHAPTPGLRLAQPTSILAALGGNRVLASDRFGSIWDRMPISAANSTVATPDALEEDNVEKMVGGEKPGVNMDGVHWALRKQLTSDHISSIFVQPPTPERVLSPSDDKPPSRSASPALPADPPAAPAQLERPLTSPRIGSIAASTPIHVIPRRASPNHSPLSSGRSSPASTPSALPIPVHVLPEVRSPPRKSIAMAADSLQVAAKRGRRARMFGFTEVESTSSSPASSAHSSPDRSQAHHRVHHRVTASLPIPPNNHTPAPATSASATSSPTFMPRHSHAAHPHPSGTSHSAPIHIPPRRRENGLKLNFDGIIPIVAPPSPGGGSTSAGVDSSVVSSPYNNALVRKKSGEILKSALKHSGPLQANGTPVVEVERPRFESRFESRSCPTTPSCPKYVHFDAQLERVKLFLHDQKPQVVSRQGSPTGDTTVSEGEEYPFHSTDDEKDKVLQVSLPNFPTAHDPSSNLYLESLFLDDDRKALKGVVMVKNIAFQKWVAVRFTFDWWQTTSEVTATYKESVKGGQYDRFAFTIKLTDMLSRIEEKTLFLAIRYNAEGHEMWDSNGGQNYQVLFTKVVPAPVAARGARDRVPIQPGMGKAVGGRTSQWSVAGGHKEDRLADLRSKLDLIQKGDADQPPLSPNSSRHFSFGRKGARSPGGSPRKFASSPSAHATELPASGGALAARYDFGTALKTTRQHSPSGKPADLPDVKTGLLNYGREATFYSPKFDQSKLSPVDSVFAAKTRVVPVPAPVSVSVPDVKVEGPSPPGTEATNTAATTPRAVTPAVPTPIVPTLASVPAPKASPRPTLPEFNVLTRISSAPPKFTVGEPEPTDSTEVSPPPLDASSSLTATPSESPRSPPVMEMAKWSPMTSDQSSDDVASLASMASYSSLIEQFCWGGDSSLEASRRSHSTSSLDNYFAGAATSGGSTPRAVSGASTAHAHGAHGHANGVSTPSSTSSYYTSFSQTPTREEMEDVETAMAEGLARMGRPMVC
ncbi:hypothetical protein IAT38_000745 [Cryptococcus sp. DSM 104549]